MTSPSTCPLCGTALQQMAQGRSTPHAAVVEHCHTCGAERGIVCSRCNSWLRAYEGDTPADLAHRHAVQLTAPWFGARARQYLTHHQQTCAK